jgi:dGTPase
VHDVIDASAARLREAAPASADAARALPRLIGFSDAMREQSAALKRLLFQSLYRHPQVNRTTEVARAVVRDLFEAYVAAPGEMRPGFAERADRHRAVADFIAGMTDRFAAREHKRLTGRDVFAELTPEPGAD